MNVAFAAEHEAFARSLVKELNDAILYPLIALLLGVALVVFLWGVMQYISNAESDEARATGKRHMIYGIIGFVIMLSAVAILTIAANTFGIDASNIRLPE